MELSGMTSLWRVHAAFESQDEARATPRLAASSAYEQFRARQTA
jgi:hypothetical protein